MAYTDSQIVAKLEIERDAIIDALSGEGAVVRYKIADREVERQRQSAMDRISEIEDLIARYNSRSTGRIRNKIRFTR